jgi:hypothetical protein
LPVKTRVIKRREQGILRPQSGRIEFQSEKDKYAMAPKGKTAAKAETGANLGFEAKLWAAADALRNNMDAAEYKHVVLGLIFLKYISDAFEAKHAELDAQRSKGADPEDPDEYRAASIFWVPKEARWSHLKANAPQPTIGTLVDDAMSAIERDNASLKGRAAKRLCPAGARQAAARPAHQSGERYRPGQQQPTVPRIRWAASTNTSSPASPAPRAKAAGSSTHPPVWCAS